MSAKLSTYSLFKRMVLDNKDIHMLSQEEVEAVQHVLLAIMDDIHEVCQKNRLTYALSGGCALGAVRHGGFIPWDDDIDICMPRKDYDRFRDCFCAEHGDRYYVQEIISCEKYDLNFMKVRLKDSVFCEFLEPEPQKAGVFIDIFPVENVYDAKLRRKWQGLMADGMQFICSCMRIRGKKEQLLEMAGESSEAVHAIRTKAGLALPFCMISFRRWLLWTEKVLKHNRDEQTECVSIPTGGKHFWGELYPRNWIFPPRLVEFEGRQYFGMAQMECYLKQMYGDYMRIPEESERERHALKAFSLPEK